MPLMVPPAVRSESDDLVAYVDHQLQAIRNAAHGLTDAQARLTPCTSALSVGGIVKHCTFVADGWGRRQQAQSADGSAATPDPQAFAAQARAFMSSFALTDDETFEGALAAFDAARERLLAQLRDLDPDERLYEPAALWDDRPEPLETTARYAVLHQIEEFARHAGHADILREQVDGATAGGLDLAVTGRPGNPYVRPWQPPEQAG